jgi:polysaccharide biosynthesis protein PslG
VGRLTHRVARLALATVALVAGLLAPAGHAAAKQLPYGFSGVVYSGPGYAPPYPGIGSDFARMRRAGVESVRIDVQWQLVEPARGQLRFALIDPMVRASAKRRIDLLPVIWTTPRWASQRPDRSDFAIWAPADPADYGRFVQQLIGRYGPRGSFWREHPRLPQRPIRQWQVWNEPSASYWWKTPDYAHSYVTLLKAAYTAVHSADRKAKVVMAGLASFLSSTSGETSTNWEDLRDFYGNGVRGYFDVAAIHAFSFRLEDVVRTVEKFRAVMRVNGDRRKPIYATEVSWPALNPRLPSERRLGFEVSPRAQRQRLAAAYRRFATDRRLGVTRAYWFSWSSSYGIDSCNPAPGSFEFVGLVQRGCQQRAFRPTPLLKTYARTVRRY